MLPLLSILFLHPACAQVEPSAGNWKTWVIQASDYELAAPVSGAALADELNWLRGQRKEVNATIRAQIRYWDAGAPSYRWLEKLTAMISARGVNTPNATRMLALVNVAMYDATIACWRNKYLHRRPRPAALDPGISPLVETPDSPSFPSEYAATSAAAAAVLSYLFPADGSLYTDLAQEAGRSRLFAGVEFPSDYLAGFDLGKRVARFP